ncbi:MAG: cob(I)yrinic acid a,c-diamide adenosyltransferase [Candidatus Aminicenantes bacterium]|nr:cob(I)yrinic acid a,c-diamide adenosyltransferase [Candidatus Aminicenantes bacterium]
MPKKPTAPPFIGRVQVYTGYGKGKTTAALGLALRAAGHGFRTYIGQFCKGRPTGEIVAARKLAPLIVIEQFGDIRFLHAEEPPAATDIRRARQGLAKCRRAMLTGEYRIVVLDEINLALYFHLLTRAEVIAFLDERLPDVEIVLTGRKAPAWLIRRADLVTEMRERKHYLAAGVAARKGIED